MFSYQQPKTKPEMTITALSTLLLSCAFVSAYGGFLCVLHNGTDLTVLRVNQRTNKWQDDTSIKPGEKHTHWFSKRYQPIEAQVSSSHPQYRKLFNLYSSTSVKCCFTTRGTKHDPHVSRVSLVPSESRSFTVYNSGNFHGRVTVKRARSASHYTSLFNKGTISVVMVPERAGSVKAYVSFIPENPELMSPYFDRGWKTSHIFGTSVLGHECYLLWGTHIEPRFVKIDCGNIYSHDVSTCNL